MPSLPELKLAGRTSPVSQTTVALCPGVVAGGRDVVVIAGPCAAETPDQVLATAEAVARAGARMLRGGAYKPRTSPYSFQGLGEPGLRLLRQAADAHHVGLVSEAVDPAHVETVARYVDVIQVGARNMQNFSLLREVGRGRTPVLLKRGPSATIAEWLMAAEYILSAGNPSVVLCERGIRTFEPFTRNTLDLSAVASVRALSHLPVIVDPSHGTGRRTHVGPMARAAVAAGADGVMVEVHCSPEEARSDGEQSLFPEQFATMMTELESVATAVGRRLAAVAPRAQAVTSGTS